MQLYRANDAGEPAYTAGKPILGQINSRQLTNVLVVVVRYFGGTKLGTGGLINAYRTAASYALDKALIIEKIVKEMYELIFNYAAVNEVMKVLKEADSEIIEQDFQEKCRILVAIGKNRAASVINKLQVIDRIEFQCLDNK